MPGYFTLKTSSTNAPVANIPTYVNYQPVVVALPYVVRIPPPPLTNSVSTVVQVRNNGTNAVICLPDEDMVIVARWIEGGAIDGIVQRVLAARRTATP